ncbi:MAG: carboxypeptidase-like regulatory domain-containing protein [Ferruginibacter sp.]
MNKKKIREVFNDRNSLLFFFFFFSLNTFSQSIISGKVVNEQGKPLSGASVIITEIETDNIVNYAITDANGRFSIFIESNLKILKIDIKKINYSFVSESITNKTQEQYYILKTKFIDLQEVILRQHSINQNGDTLSYNVNVFADKKDRSIADVLAKMPGIEIQADGRVLYQGSPIQKYYIDGLDLLEGQYNLANNNLPYKSVTSVQILENHQPIKILDSLVSSNKTSLNIKLKNNVSLTGVAKTGIGLSPFLWDINITPMIFKKKKQFVFSYQANNIGYDASQEVKVLTLEAFIEQLDNPTQKRDLLSVVPLQFPDVSSKRYLHNNINMLAANYLTKLKNDVEFKFNVSYFNDHQKQEGENTTEYFSPSGNILLHEKISNLVYDNDLQTNLTVQKNTPKFYLKNSFKTQINWDKQEGNIVTTAGNILQKLKNPYYSFSNQLKLISKIGKKLFTIYSFINYNKTPQSLNVTPGQFNDVLNSGNFYKSLNQEITKNNFQTNNYIEFTKSLKKYVLISKMGFSIQIQNTESDIFVDSIAKQNQFQNNQENNAVKLYFHPNLTYKKNRYEVKLQLPITYNIINIADKKSNQEQMFSGITVSPSINTEYAITNSWKMTLGLEFNNNFQNIGQTLYGYILSNYKNLQQSNYPIAKNKNYSLTSTLVYKNPIQSLFFSSFYTFLKTQDPFILQDEIQPNGTHILSAKSIQNEINSHTVSSKISKYFNRIKTSFSLGIDFSFQERSQFVNSSLLKTVNQNIKPNFKINIRYIKDLSIEYTIAPNFNYNKIKTQSIQRLFALNENFKLNIYPKANQYIGLSLEHYYNNSISVKKHNLYTDLLYRYTLTKRKIDLELKCTNFFNEKEFITSNFTANYYYQSFFQIRPRQILANIKFNF